MKKIKNVAWDIVLAYTAILSVKGLVEWANEFRLYLKDRKFHK